MNHKNQEERELARQIVLRHGWNTMCYQILNPGFLYWFHPTIDAVIGYVETVGYRVVAGAPICSKQFLEVVLEAFESETAKLGIHVCYFGAQDRLVDLQSRVGIQQVHRVLVGTQPIWNPQTWVDTVLEKPSIRAQLRRAQNHFVEVCEWKHHHAENNPELLTVLQTWLSERAMPGMSFLVEPNTLDTLADRRVFVATVDSSVVGYLVATPIPSRQGWLIEQQIRISSTPNGTIELLLHLAMQTFATEGCTFVTLGLAPLHTLGQEKQQKSDPSFNKLFSVIKYVGSKYYNFGGLVAFKQKFKPDSWEQVYVVSFNKPITFPMLYAVASAFTGGKLLRFFLNTLTGKKQ